MSLSTPLMPESLSSSRVTTSRSTTSGDAPGIRDADEHDRLVEIGELVGVEPGSAASPNTTSAIIVTTVMIGRLMAKSEMNMAGA